MGGYYKVQLQALAQLIMQLGECANDMHSAMKQLQDLGPEGAGSAELEQACDEFQDKWGYGIGLIADATGGITTGLSESRKIYEVLEDQIAGSFKASEKAGSK